MAKFTNLLNERGELVNGRMRPDTFADYFGKVQRARNNDIDQQRQEAPDVELIYETEADVKQDSFTAKPCTKILRFWSLSQEDLIDCAWIFGKATRVK